MNKVTFQTRVWSPDDLKKYYPLRKQSTLSNFEVDKHWQKVLAILTNGSEMGDSELPEPTCPMTSLEVSRGIQIARHHHMAIPRTRLSRDTEGKTIIQAKMVLQQIADIP
jgi:hypothetical protein